MTMMLTRSGREVDIHEPQPQTIRLVDIALALSRIPRFCGHTLRTWSVADHSLLVADLVSAADPDLQLAALLHDAHEAYMGDIILPLQYALNHRQPSYSIPLATTLLKNIAGDLDTAIARAFALDPEMMQRPEIKEADKLALAVEAKLLMPPHPPWPGLPVLTDPLPALPVRDQMAAQNHFILRALTLIQARHGVAPEPSAATEPTTPIPEAPATAEPTAGDGA